MLLYFAYLIKLCLKINKLTKCSFSGRLFLFVQNLQNGVNGEMKLKEDIFGNGHV